MRKSVVNLSPCLEPPKQILTGLPADGLIIQTDNPNLEFGNDDSVSAVDACSGLEVAVVSCHRMPHGSGVTRWMV